MALALTLEILEGFFVIDRLDVGILKLSLITLYGRFHILHAGLLLLRGVLVRCLSVWSVQLLLTAHNPHFLGALLLSDVAHRYNDLFSRL